MYETRVVVLRTRLFSGGEEPPALRSLSSHFRITELAVGEHVEATTEADWDRVLEAILDSDRCITV